MKICSLKLMLRTRFKVTFACIDLLTAECCKNQIEVLMQGTKIFVLLDLTSVTHSFCICSDMEISVSGHFAETTNIKNRQSGTACIYRIIYRSSTCVG